MKAHKTTGFATCLLTTCLTAGFASASESDVAQESASVSASTAERGSPSEPWIRRWAPERHMVELGIYGGLFLPSPEHEVFEPDRDLPLQGWRELRRVNGEIGLRLGYFPIRFFGVEAEGGAMPARTLDNDQRATLWHLRAHAVAQLGLWSVTPFLVFGAGLLSVASEREALGNNINASIHFGGGAKFYLNRWVALRLDLRGIVAARQGVDEGAAVHGEVLAGLSFTLGRKKKEESARSDRDGDGFYDDEDACPDEPGVAPDGCPIRDRDGDGFPDDVDACPDEPGVAPDGCPIRDRDGDGIPDHIDQCPDDPETYNGFEDEDGCPDELPEEVKEFTGTIEGIFFDFNKDTIKPMSRPVLDRAVSVLEKYPSIRIEISGHTDIIGTRDYNIGLSRRRAESVRRYLIEKGIEDTRIKTRGAGPDEPIADNSIQEGRDKNRRIEFKVLQQGE